jgi:hypothetical protein
VLWSETQATEYAAVLTMVINDIGNYGCFPDCKENVSKPLLAEVNVNLIKRRPMNPGAAYGMTLQYLFSFILTIVSVYSSLHCTCTRPILLFVPSRLEH